MKKHNHCLAFSSAGPQSQTYYVSFDSFTEHLRWHRHAAKVPCAQCTSVSKRKRENTSICCAARLRGQLHCTVHASERLRDEGEEKGMHQRWPYSHPISLPTSTLFRPMLFKNKCLGVFRVIANTLGFCSFELKWATARKPLI